MAGEQQLRMTTTRNPRLCDRARARYLLLGTSAAPLWRVRVRVDVVLQFVLTDVRGGESERLRQYVPLVGVRNGNQGTRIG